MNFICNQVHCLLETFTGQGISLNHDKRRWEPDCNWDDIACVIYQPPFKMHACTVIYSACMHTWDIYQQCMHACIGLSVNVVCFCCKVGSVTFYVLHPHGATHMNHSWYEESTEEENDVSLVAGSRQGRQRSRYSRLCVSGGIVSDSEEMPAA